MEYEGREVNPSAEVGGMLSRSRSISQDNFGGSLLEPLCGLAIELEKHGLKRGHENASRTPVAVFRRGCGYRLCEFARVLSHAVGGGAKRGNFSCLSA